MYNIGAIDMYNSKYVASYYMMYASVYVCSGSDACMPACMRGFFMVPVVY